MTRRPLAAWLGAWLGASLLLGGCSAAGGGGPAASPPPLVSKPVSFSILEDYDKGENLRGVARDFALMNELEVRTWRGSFGWDDYEPERGRYDFAWLHDFVELARRHGIQLRPYLGYTAPWAAAGGDDDQAWNDPPADVEDWYRFVHAVASALRRHPNILSYEIYNEENVPLWWDGTAAEYNRVLARGAAAVRDADPDAAVLFGGMVFPDVEWIEAACVTHGNAGAFDVMPFHAYPETWTPDSVTVENYLDASYRDVFLPTLADDCRDQPVWINETGYATTPGRTERDQAGWWARAIATFLADPRVEHIGIYEIKDLREDSPVIGDAPNYHLGLVRLDGTKKLAFHTVDLLTDLLDVGTLTVADVELAVTATAGRPGALHHHLFVRPDGAQVLIVWDRTAGPTLDVRLTRPGGTATSYALNGTSTRYAAFDGRRLTGIRLEPGEVRIFRIDP